ncbi:MRG/MORF4L-binding protein isoform X2 [Orussus abietinus]|uniref:MRG/MORF4L-binding protein isoform X2 n=1 Tax=Orussus abietinus TaxID=222816 RepID=UPI000625B7CA|nr:MRG/MORF4L-binding protein isoform X2 [Orussus abietinus]
MSVKEKPADLSEEIEWNVENEIQLFFAMNGHKPVGINKYFHMVCIWEKFRAAIHKEISLKMIWDHLESMYDLMALDDTEDLPFPSSEIDFTLPELEFSGFIKSRKKEEPDVKGIKEAEKKKEEIKKSIKEPEIKKEKQRDVKDVKKDIKPMKGRPKGKDDVEEPGSIGKKERKDSSDAIREGLKRVPKRPTRQSIDSTSKASSSPRDTPPPKRRRI